MELQTLSLLVVGATFALYIGIAFWARARSTSDFYVAGAHIHPVANGMATAADWMSAASFISMAGLIAFLGYGGSAYLMGWTGGYVLMATLLAPYLRKFGKYTVPAMATAADWMSAASFISMAGLIAFLGYGGSAYLMGWTGGYVLMATLLAPYLRKFGKYTVPHFVGDRFYSQTARVVAVLALLAISITYVIGQMRGVGIAFSNILNVDLTTGLVAGMVVVFFYAVFGGMKGITYTQIAQYVVMIFAYTVPAVFISLQLTGNPLPQAGLGSTLAGEDRYLLEALDKTLVDLGFGAYTALTGMTLPNMFLLTLALMLGTAGLPHVIVRFFTVPRIRDARRSAGWTLVFIGLLYTTAPAVGAMAMWNLLNTVQPGEVGSEQGSLVIEERPDWMRRWENTGLLAIEDKNGDGRLQYYNEQNERFAEKVEEQHGWKGSELTTVDRDIMVLANPEIARLPNWVIALVAAGGIAAALSTAAGLLLAISSAISHDLLKSVFTPRMSEKQELMTGRIAMTGAILLAGYLGLNPPGFAAEVVALAFGLAAASLFPTLVMGIFFKRINNAGAVAGMLAGLTTTLAYIITYKGWFYLPGTNFLPDTPEYWLLGINPSGIGVIGAVVNFATAFVVASFTRPTPASIRELVDGVRVPRA